MKELTREWVAKEPWRGRGGSSLVYRMVAGMEAGKIILIEPKDWGGRKYPPTAVVRYIEKKYKRRHIVLKHAGGLGWMVERVE